MTSLTHIALVGWIPAVLALFAMVPARRAVIVSFLAGWLLLPNTGYLLEALPEYTKVSACCVAPALGAVLFDLRRIISFRVRWLDMPMVLWCICPLLSSLSNGLGIYDGMSAVAGRVIGWGLPYLLGRVYVRDLSGLRDLAVGIFIAGLVYAPLCLYEMRMSPQLHRMLYGFHSRYRFSGVHRLGGYRPRVFLETGIALGFWMVACSVTGLWLWAGSVLKRLWGIPVGWLVSLLLAVTVLCRSAGALVWLAFGSAAMFIAKWTRSRVPLFVLVAIAPAFAATRATGLWSGRELVAVSRSFLGESRAGSLRVRMENDDMLVEKASRRPVLGWAAWGRYRIHDEAGRDISRTDGLWIQALGKNGFVGLASLMATLLLPAVVLALRYPPKLWWSPSLAPAAGLAMVVVLSMLDHLLNSQENAIISFAVGGVSGFCARSCRLAAAPGVALAERAELACASSSARMSAW